MDVVINGIYKHKKGNMYIVQDIATHSETLEKMVVYRALYGDSKLWVRPYNEFVDGRFQYVVIEDKRLNIDKK